MLSNYKRVLLFDVETTGLNFLEDKVIEFGYVLLENGVNIEEGSIMVNWYEHNSNFVLPEIITKITSITEEILRSEGINPLLAVNKINELMQSADIVISHNQLFDYNMVKSMIEEFYEFGFINEPDYLDTLLVVAENKPWSKESTHKLTDACKYWNVSLEKAHRAIDDIIATWMLLNAIEATGVNINEYINKWGFYSKYSSVEKVRAQAPLKITPQAIRFLK